MNKGKLFLYSFGVVLFLSSCCGGNDDIPLNNTVIVDVFNLDRSDNLLDFDGSLVFDTIKLRDADTMEEIVCLTDQDSRKLVFLPMTKAQASGDLEISELILELDSLSYALTIRYDKEEIRCAGTELRVNTYNFEGQEFEFDKNLISNTIELLVDL